MATYKLTLRAFAILTHTRTHTRALRVACQLESCIEFPLTVSQLVCLPLSLTRLQSALPV